ncbi:uncharacterized protein MONBRDRAFT_30175 [Monosiga brevicollis MX1]|uniref:Uncharacterized protein n=1 Tax=Monosiga brevicollis TaxID=81824 RepID=A9VD79_MONBE|nr:uncharacterized protein MONBRDRAFT_30175 [Monosiga brevicollis MX1]EDQ84482.1 predicted protein [Monosiga brevicollis MX1]|eukprot:XP_001750669.1 hypothetical protein [Monosiga brevicollis MX1]
MTTSPSAASEAATETALPRGSKGSSGQRLASGRARRRGRVHLYNLETGLKVPEQSAPRRSNLVRFMVDHDMVVPDLKHQANVKRRGKHPNLVFLTPVDCYSLLLNNQQASALVSSRLTQIADQTAADMMQMSRAAYLEVRASLDSSALAYARAAAQGSGNDSFCDLDDTLDHSFASLGPRVSTPQADGLAGSQRQLARQPSPSLDDSAVTTGTPSHTPLRALRLFDMGAMGRASSKAAPALDDSVLADGSLPASPCPLDVKPHTGLANAQSEPTCPTCCKCDVEALQVFVHQDAVDMSALRSALVTLLARLDSVSHRNFDGMYAERRALPTRVPTPLNQEPRRGNLQACPNITIAVGGYVPRNRANHLIGRPAPGQHFPISKNPTHNLSLSLSLSLSSSSSLSLSLSLSLSYKLMLVEKELL